MKHRTRVLAVAITAAMVVVGTTSYALAVSGGGTNQTWTMNKPCGRQVAREAGYEVVTWGPGILKAIVAHPKPLDFAVSAIDDLCVVTMGITGHLGPATTISDRSP